MISNIYTKTAVLALIHIFASFFIFQANCDAKADISSQVAENELIVQFEKNVPEDRVLALLNNLGASIKEKVDALDAYILTLPSLVSVEQAVNHLKGHKLVKAVEPNYLLPIQAVPNDPLFEKQWALKDTGGTMPKLTDIDMIKAWDRTQGFSGVVIAVIDTGVDYNHEDLAANIWHNPGEISGNGIDDDQNGYIDDIIGWDFVDARSGAEGEDFETPDNDPMDSHGHGTHVAGIAAAVGNNGLGIAGVAWNSKIMPLRAGYKTIKGGMMVASHHAARAIIYAADNGAHIINLSWAGKHKSILVERAIAYAAENGVLVCAAGGNKNTNDPSYPAAFDNAAIISVGSVDRNGNKAFTSNFGDWVDVSAPGVAIYSTYPNNQYRYMSGTSMATPVVSGIAALIWSLNPNPTNLQVKDMILNSVDYLDSLIGQVLTGGQVNANNALLYTTGAQLQSGGGVQDFVTRFYQQCLERTPDQAGLDNWVNALQNGNQYGADVANGFIFSPEFTNLNTSNEQFVTILYRVFFDREPDTAGYNSWVNLLYGGASRQDALNGFIYSQEFENLCASYGIAPYPA